MNISYRRVEARNPTDRRYEVLLDGNVIGSVQTNFVGRKWSNDIGWSYYRTRGAAARALRNAALARMRREA